MKNLTDSIRLAAALLAGVLGEAPAFTATNWVTTTVDSGPGSLRQAILDANANPGPDAIHFNIPGNGVQTIAPASTLPVLWDTTTLDGYTQPGATPNTLTNGDNAVLHIRLCGTNASNTDALFVKGSSCVVRGLVIVGWEGRGIVIENAATNRIAGNFIGVDADGTTPGSNAWAGIALYGSTGGIVGGLEPSERNVIAANVGQGVLLADGVGGVASAWNQIAGNLIGTDATGTSALGNGEFGIEIVGASDNRVIRNVVSGNRTGLLLWQPAATRNSIEGNFIGTDASGTRVLSNAWWGILLDNATTNFLGGANLAERNIISGNGYEGVNIANSEAIGNVVSGNYIGTDVSGRNPLPNGSGVAMSGPNNTIGGTAPGAGNRVAFNAGAGIVVAAELNNAIRCNSIFANGGLGIDLGADGVTANDPGDSDTGANQLQNFPVIIEAATGTGTQIRGTLNSLPNATFQIDLYSNAQPAPSGYGDGEAYLGAALVTTAADGNGSFLFTTSAPVPVGRFVTATATDSAGSTSEFSAAVPLLTNSDSPRITLQPLPQSVVQGGAAAFKATASGIEPLHFQWQKDGTNLSGASALTLAITNVQVSDAGVYRVVVTNDYGTDTSLGALLTVGVAPAISIQPQSRGAFPGQTATFVVAASGTDLLAYQWWRNGTFIANATDSSYTITNAQRSDVAAYVVTVRNPYGTAVSTPVALTLKLPLAIISQPRSETNIVGAEAVFSVMAEGTPPLEFQWRKGGIAIPGAISNVLLLPTVQLIDATNYSVTISNADASLESGSASLTVRRPKAGDVDVSFVTKAMINDWVGQALLQGDGKVLIGGSFSAVHGLASRGVARLNCDGSTDLTFGNRLVDFDLQNITFMAMQADGKMLITGRLTLPTGEEQHPIIRLEPDGAVDPSFMGNPTLPDDIVKAMVPQPNGKILVAGSFTNINGLSRNRLARLNTDGTLDTAFFDGLAGANGAVAVLAAQSDGKLIIGGAFTTVNGQARSQIARLNDDGTLDTTFLDGLVGVSGYGVSCLALQPDGKVLIGGTFTSVNGQPRGGIARLNCDGTLDTEFLGGLAGADGSVYSLAVQSDGQIVLGGWFTSVNGQPCSGVARLNHSGTLDGSYSPELRGNVIVFGLSLQADGKALVVGSFAKVNGQPRKGIARLNTDGTLDTAFENGSGLANGQVMALVRQTNGKSVVGGLFTSVNGQPQGRIARMNADGTLDAGFHAGEEGANDVVSSLALRAEDKVLVGGAFTSINGQPRNRIAQLNADGTLDSTFLNGLAGADGPVAAVAKDPDGKVLLGGAFTSVNGSPRNRIARLNANGTLDTAFLDGLPGANNYAVDAIAALAGGRVLIGGDFTTVNGQARNHIARLNANGSLDSDFLASLVETNASGYVEVRTLVLQRDGKILVGGKFSTVNGQPRNAIARLNTDGTLDLSFASLVQGTDSRVDSILVLDGGKIVVGGFFGSMGGTSRSRLARLNPDGSLDSVFGDSLTLANSAVTALALQDDNRLLIGGWFGGVNGIPASGLARLWLDGLRIVTSDGSLGFEAGQFGFDVVGIPGQTVVIECSPNLDPRVWTSLQTNTLGNGPIHFNDPQSDAAASRFYRAGLAQ